MNGNDLLSRVDSFADVLFVVALSSIRVFAAFNVLPATGGQFIQGLTRAGIVALLGTYIAFGMPFADVSELTAMRWFVLAIKETMIGLVIGFMASIVFWVAESVGALIDTQAGYNSVQMSNPLSGEQSTPVSNLLVQLTVAVFFTLGGMLIFVGVLFESFMAWPLLSPLPSMQGISDLVFLQRIDTLMESVVKFSAPALLVLLLIDLSFGLITRAADKLEPSGLAQPIKGAVTMLLLALFAGVFIGQVRHLLVPLGLIDLLKTLIPVGS